MPTEPQPVTLAEVVHVAVDVCDDGSSGLDDLLASFEDADEPIAAIDNLQERLAIALGPVEDEDYEPGLVMARAVIVYLQYRRDELGADAMELLRLAARAEFDGKPPATVAAWLAERRVTF